MIYLASPYTHPDPKIVEERYIKTLKVMSILLNNGQFVFSPIVHCHTIATNYGLKTDYLFWKEYNEHFMNLSTELIVLKLHDWQNSKGVAHEIDYMTNQGKSIIYITGDELRYEHR
jgi:hypothetical protein